jgi:hypothetical protein
MDFFVSLLQPSAYIVISYVTSKMFRKAGHGKNWTTLQQEKNRLHENNFLPNSKLFGNHISIL